MAIGIRMLLIVVLPVATPLVLAQDRSRILGILEQLVEDFGVQGQDARVVLEGLGASYQIPIIVEPEVQGAVTFEIHHAPLRTVLEAICQPRGWSYVVAADGYLVVRRFVTRIYPVDYLQLVQTGSSSASVNLSETAGTGAAGLSGTSSIVAGGAVAGGASLPATAAANGASAGSSGSSTLSLAQQNDADFWGRLETDLKGMVGEGETLVVNRFAGVVQLRGTMRSHAVLEAYLRRVMERVGRQARISVKIVEVDLNDQSKSGIDWSVATTALARISRLGALSAAGSTSSGPITQAGPIAFDPDTFTGTIGIGQVQAAISALAEQGTVHIESKPEIAALNNQTAFVQVSEDQPFFSRSNTTTINAGATNASASLPIVATNYTENTVAFGNILEITVQIADDFTTKLSLSPAITELKGTVTSPDGQETAPITGTKRARTTVFVKNHETAVVGGFITETKATENRSIPGLNQIPLLGRAFGSRGTATTRTELVFFVTVNSEAPPPVIPSEIGFAPSPIAAAAPGPMTARAVERVEMQ